MDQRTLYYLPLIHHFRALVQGKELRRTVGVNPKNGPIFAGMHEYLIHASSPSKREHACFSTQASSRACKDACHRVPVNAVCF
jgi:hypothetical protein